MLILAHSKQKKNIKQILFLYLWTFRSYMGSQPFKFLFVILNQNSFSTLFKIHVLEYSIPLTQTKSSFLTTWLNPLGVIFMDSF